MRLIEVFGLDYEKVPKTIGYKCNYIIPLTIEDQEEALRKPYWAFRFAREVPGADIRKCEEVVCKNPRYAYYFALYIPGADIRRCEEAACKDPEWARSFADIRKWRGSSM